MDGMGWDGEVSFSLHFVHAVDREAAAAELPALPALATTAGSLTIKLPWLSLARIAFHSSVMISFLGLGPSVNSNAATAIMVKMVNPCAYIPRCQDERSGGEVVSKP